MPETTIYERPPLKFHQEIPVFSNEDDYVRNYFSIAHDHMVVYKRDGTNPFIPEELWVESEEATRVLLKMYLPENAKLLDVGVGLGRLISPLEKVAKYGMDISYDYLEVSRGKQIEVCFSKIEDMPYRKEFFDVVVCTDVLEHVLDLNACCEKIWSVLKSQGILIVRVPYREDLGVYLSESYPYRYAHLRAFDEYSIRLLFEKIFKGKVLACETAGYRSDATRLRCRIPKCDGLVLRFLALVKWVSRGVHDRLVKKLFRAIEMNVVVKKLG